MYFLRVLPKLMIVKKLCSLPTKYQKKEKKKEENKKTHKTKNTHKREGKKKVNRKTPTIVSTELFKGGTQFPQFRESSETSRAQHSSTTTQSSHTAWREQPCAELLEAYIEE